MNPDAPVRIDFPGSSVHETLEPYGKILAAILLISMACAFSHRPSTTC